MPSRRRTSIVASLAAIWWLATFLATHVPLDVPSPAAGADKAVHAGMYLGLAMLILATIRSLRIVSMWTAAIVVLLLAPYAAMDEWTQQFVPTRTADVWDWAADMLGGTTGSVLFLIGQSLLRRR